jgi:hypothetical protein
MRALLGIGMILVAQFKHDTNFSLHVVPIALALLAMDMDTTRCKKS